MFYSYIIKSLRTGKYYVGSCRDLVQRLKEHNQGKTKSTKSARPWEEIYSEHFQTKQEAYKREQQIKSYKGGNAFKKLIMVVIRKGAGEV